MTTLSTPLTWTASAHGVGDFNSDIRNNMRWVAGFAAGSKPVARVRQSTAPSLPDQWATMSFNTAVINRGDTPMWAGGNPSRLTASVTGIYHCGACLRFDPTTANRALRIILNGVEASAIVQHDNVGVSTDAYTTINISTLYQLTAADYIEVQSFQDSGSTITGTVEGLASPVFWAYWVSAAD